jgi:hypothetical protein
MKLTKTDKKFKICEKQTNTNKNKKMGKTEQKIRKTEQKFVKKEQKPNKIFY